MEKRREFGNDFEIDIGWRFFAILVVFALVISLFIKP